MEEIKIYVANLAAYNDGELRGDWFTLPCEMDDIFKRVFTEDELDVDGQPNGDWAIHDYEASFKIDEYTSIDYLNEVAELFNTLSSEDISILLALKEEGVLNDLSEGKEYLDSVIRYHNCNEMKDIAFLEIREKFGDNSEYHFFLRHFDYESYGNELETTGTYLFLENDTAVQYINQ